MKKLRDYIDRYWLLVGMPLLAAFFYAYDPARPAYRHFFVPCLLHRATGLHCPGCGGQRAAHQLLHGHLMQALDYNALAVGLLPLLAAWVFVRQWNALRLKPRLDFAPPPAAGWWLLGVTLLFFLLRNLPAFSWLAP